MMHTRKIYIEKQMLSQTVIAKKQNYLTYLVNTSSLPKKSSHDLQNKFASNFVIWSFSFSRFAFFARVHSQFQGRQVSINGLVL